MNGANPYIYSIKGLTPRMVCTNFFLKIYLKQAQKAHSILRFIYDKKKQREVINKIRDLTSMKNKFGVEIVILLYQLFKDQNEDNEPKHKMTFYELVKQAQKNIKVDLLNNMQN